jgi:hypothetical protein
MDWISGISLEPVLPLTRNILDITPKVIMEFFTFDLKMVALQKHGSHSANCRSVFCLNLNAEPGNY